ncbi:hypothetical protein [Paraburkholderia eburnea]|uniref:hypothetical protein n=1 Tax=Paraburkholderia eburnea TaxID=1189126 RepID=UPI0011AFE0D8|nr:hypothetical protein [Paraburkholderia eburnea]
MRVLFIAFSEPLLSHADLLEFMPFHAAGPARYCGCGIQSVVLPPGIPSSRASARTVRKPSALVGILGLDKKPGNGMATQKGCRSSLLIFAFPKRLNPPIPSSTHCIY